MTEKMAPYAHNLKPKLVPLDSLREAPWNPRTHPEENLLAVMASLDHFGQVEPLVVRKGTQEVLAGHGRLEAMRRLGWTQCQAVYLDVDEVQAKAIAVALNRTGELAAWDEAQLAAVLQEVAAALPPGELGWSDAQLEKLLSQGVTPELDQGGLPEEATPPGQVPEPGVRTVQLLLTEVTLPLFYDAVAKLLPAYGLDNYHDLVLRVLQEDCARRGL